MRQVYRSKQVLQFPSRSYPDYSLKNDAVAVDEETFEKIMEMFSSKVEIGFGKFLFIEQLNQIEKLSKAMKYQGIQTRLPFEFEIK